MKKALRLLTGGGKRRPAGRKAVRNRTPWPRKLLDAVCSIPLKALESKWNNDLWDQAK